MFLRVFYLKPGKPLNLIGFYFCNFYDDCCCNALHNQSKACTLVHQGMGWSIRIGSAEASIFSTRSVS